MTCRSTHAGSASTSWALLESKGILTDSVVTSIFHALRREYKTNPPNTSRYTDDRARERYIENLTDTRRRVNWASNSSNEKNTKSIMGRLDLAIAQIATPPEDLLYAVYQLKNRTDKLTDKIEDLLQSIATELGVDSDSVKENYIKLLKKAEKAKTLPTISDRTVEFARECGIPENHSILSVLDNLLEQASQVRKYNSKAVDTGPRIILEDVEGPARATHIEGLEVHQMGFDRRNGRLEVVIKDMGTGELNKYAYCNAQDEYLYWVGDSDLFGKTWSNRIRGNPYYFYHSQEFAKRAGYAPKCLTCGQFANNKHSCPIVRTPTELTFHNTIKPWSKQFLPETSGYRAYRKPHILLPPATELREAFSAGAVTINDVRDDAFASGNITVYLDENFETKVNLSKFHCTCDSYMKNGTCNDIKKVSDAVLERLKPTINKFANLNNIKKNKLMEKNQNKLAQLAVEKINKIYQQDWALSEEYLSEAQKFWQSKKGSVQYSEDFKTFQEKYFQLKNTPVPYMKNNALGGLATRKSGQGFGVELEFDFEEIVKPIDREKALKKIGVELYEAGLTYEEEQVPYHSASKRGYRDTHSTNGIGNWSFEADGSVEGELVSPTMYDEPETWEKLEKAVEILRRNGATVSTSVGSHVHVGTGFYNGDILKYTELSRLMNQYEDTTYRLASDPKRGTHRMNGYSKPIAAVPPAGFTRLSAAFCHTGRNSLNLGHLNGDKKDHPEFRLFDGTLDPGAIQTQIKIAVGMTHAAVRQAKEVGGTKRPKETLGTHSILVEQAKADGRKYGLEEETATFRSLLDTLFTRTQDKDQALAVFTKTKWVKQDLEPKRRRR